MIFQLTDELSGILAGALQDYFATMPIAQAYRWNRNPALSKIGIYDQYPDEARIYPSIIVKGLIGNSEEAGFNQMAGPLPSTVSIIDDPEGVVGEEFSGWYNPRAEFSVESTHDMDVRRVADIVWVAVVRTLQFTVPRETNGNVMWQLPNVIGLTGRGTRADTNNRPIHFVNLASSFKVAWHDHQELEDTFLTARANVTILDC